MGVLDRENQARAETRGAETRAISGTPWTPWESPYFPYNAGGPVHPARSGGINGVDGMLRLQPVYSSVRILAEGVAMTPLQQFRDTGDRKAKMPPGPLLTKASAFINNFDWLFQYVTSAGLQGYAPGYITSRDGYGYPTTVEWLPPEDFTAVDPKPWNPAKVKFFFAGTEIPRSDLLLVNAFTIPGRSLGISPMRYFQLLIEAGHGALAYGDGWYRSGGFPPGTFQNKNYEVTDEQATEIKRKLVRAQRRREPLVYGADWEYKPVVVPPNEAQFVEAMQLNATQIAAIYGVPPHRVGGSTAGGSVNYSNVESEGLALVQDTLDPWLVRLETALADCLPVSQYAQFNRNARLRTTIAERYAAYRTARDIGIYNVDEIRDLEDRPPIPKPKDADDYDGTDYTPLQIQVAAARGIKEIIGEGNGPGGGGAVETNPQAAPKQGPGMLAAFQPKPPAAVNGNGNRG